MALREALERALAPQYRLLDELGRGGMARVYLAEDPKLKTRVAVKVLAPELASQVSVARFVQEIETMATLDNLHILRIISAGEADGLPFYVMPFIAGESLRARLEREGPLPVNDAIRLLREVAEALAHAHEHRTPTIHRDIKPDNILLHGTHAVVADFGIAKALKESAGPTITETDTIIGTALYMAPEQFYSGAPVGPAADLYALGVVAYEMLTGAAPFRELSGPSQIAAKSSRPPVPVEQVRPETSGALAELVGQLLAPAPEGRPRSAAEVVRRIDALSAGYRPGPGKWRRYALAGAAVVLLAAGYLGASDSLDSLMRSGALPDDARVLVADVESTTGDSSTARALTDALRIDLSGAKGVAIVSRAEIENALRRLALPLSTPISDSLAREIARRDGHQALVSVSVSPLGAGFSLAARVRTPDGERELASIRESATSTQDLLDALDRLSKQLRRRLGESTLSLSRAPALPAVTTRSYDALRLYADAMDAERKDNIGSMRALLEQSLTVDSTFAMASRRLAVLYSNELNFVRAVPLARRAARDAERLPPVERHYVLGSSAMVLNDVPAAVRAFEEALRHDPNNTQVLNNLEATLVSAGQFERAIEVEAHLRTVDTTAVRPGAVNSLLILGRSDEALALATQYVNGGYPRGPSMLLLARALIGAGQRDSGLAVLRRVIREFPSESNIGANARAVLADDLRMRGRAREAFALRRETVRARWAASAPTPQGLVFELAWQMAWAARLGVPESERRRMFDTSSFVAALDSVPLANQTPSLPFALVLSGQFDAGLAQFDRFLSAVDPELRRNQQEFLDYSRGQLLLFGGRTAEGLRLVRDNRGADSPRSESDLVGLAYLELGQPDSAIAEWERSLRRPALNASNLDANQLPIILPTLGRLYAERGDTARAIARLEEFVDLWSDADPELQPRVTEARALLARLRPAADQGRGVQVPARTP